MAEKQDNLVSQPLKTFMSDMTKIYVALYQTGNLPAIKKCTSYISSEASLVRWINHAFTHEKHPLVIAVEQKNYEFASFLIDHGLIPENRITLATDHPSFILLLLIDTRVSALKETAKLVKAVLPSIIAQQNVGLLSIILHYLSSHPNLKAKINEISWDEHPLLLAVKKRNALLMGLLLRHALVPRRTYSLIQLAYDDPEALSALACHPLCPQDLSTEIRQRLASLLSSEPNQSTKVLLSESEIVLLQEINQALAQFNSNAMNHLSTHKEITLLTSFRALRFMIEKQDLRLLKVSLTAAHKFPGFSLVNVVNQVST